MPAHAPGEGLGPGHFRRHRREVSVHSVKLSGHADPPGVHALITELQALALLRGTRRILMDESDPEPGLVGFSDIAENGARLANCARPSVQPHRGHRREPIIRGQSIRCSVCWRTSSERIP